MTQLSLQQKRIYLKEKYSKNNKFQISINVFEKISASKPDHKFNNLIKLISDPHLLLQAISNISNKSGSTTPGPSTDLSTVDGISLTTVYNISESLKNKTFRFHPVKRIYIDKTGKNPNLDKEISKLYNKKQLTPEILKKLKARPLGIPSFNDKIVQEAIRIILNAIYEPEFKRVSLNYGFRPKLGVQDAIYSIQTKAKSMEYAIEADIQGAFDNVKFEILINILRKKISDEQFLSLILGGLKCGINYSQQFEETRTTQGSVLSPLLYNIYFHEFDLYIHNQFTTYINETNFLENRDPKAPNRFYTKISKQKLKLKIPNLKIQLQENFKKYGPNSKEFQNIFKIYKNNFPKYKLLDKIQKNTPSRAKSRQTIRFFYIRYADDWLFLTNASLENVEKYKNMFSNWIQKNLSLTLSSTKTLTTKLTSKKKKLSKKIHFLGFQLSYYATKKNMLIGYKIKFKSNIMNRKTFKTINKNKKRSTFTQRTTNPTLIAAFDRNRVFKKLESLRIIKKHNGQWQGCRKPEWGVLTIPEIIQKYNYIIRGYANFYGPILHYKNDISQLHYLLKYSCIHTLSQKLQLTLRGTMKKFGKDITVYYETTTKNLNKDGTIEVLTNKHSISLLTWPQVQSIIEIQTKNFRTKAYEKSSYLNQYFSNIDDIPLVTINWRTVYKLSQYCCICGSQENIQFHHVKHVRIGKVSGFLQVMNQLNRKQIPCCSYCHRKIHSGAYDSLKLSDLYDQELAII